MTTPIKDAAAALGRLGGKRKSEKKATAARENGKKGGRPKKEKHRIVVVLLADGQVWESHERLVDRMWSTYECYEMTDSHDVIACATEALTASLVDHSCYTGFDSAPVGAYVLMGPGA